MRRIVVAAVMLVAIALAAFLLTRPGAAPAAPAPVAIASRAIEQRATTATAPATTAATTPTQPPTQPTTQPTTQPATTSSSKVAPLAAKARVPARGLVMRDDEESRSPGAVGTMSKESIRAAVRVALPKVQACYESALKVSPDLAGNVSVSFTLVAGDDGKGTVTEGEVADSDTSSPFFDACVLKEVAGAEFDAPGGSGTVKVT
ncbi:MAG TPA: AgmX/PglI C-terminal domain-containing protein, partial [Myxococcota bacterium]